MIFHDFLTIYFVIFARNKYKAVHFCISEQCLFLSVLFKKFVLVLIPVHNCAAKHSVIQFGVFAKRFGFVLHVIENILSQLQFSFVSPVFTLYEVSTKI